jgi:hypothetical protein
VSEARCCLSSPLDCLSFGAREEGRVLTGSWQARRGGSAPSPSLPLHSHIPFALTSGYFASQTSRAEANLQEAEALAPSVVGGGGGHCAECVDLPGARGLQRTYGARVPPHPVLTTVILIFLKQNTVKETAALTPDLGTHTVWGRKVCSTATTRTVYAATTFQCAHTPPTERSLLPLLVICCSRPTEILPCY